MQTLESLKRSIDSVQDLETVVRTMKTLAAVSIRQYEQAVDSLADYAEAVELGLRMVLWHAQPLPQMLAAGAERATGAIVFGSDQGMCGQFNEQIASFVHEQAAGDQAWRFMAVGARLAGRLEDARIAVDHELPVPGSATGITPLVTEMLTHLESWRNRQRLGRVLVFYNRRHSASSYQPHVQPLLPIDPARWRSAHERKWPSRTLPAYTMRSPALLSQLIRHYLFISLFRACAESLAGENASRIASMQAAERNIQERLAELRGQYHHQRQTSITEELLEVVTGFEALAGNEEARATGKAVGPGARHLERPA